MLTGCMCDGQKTKLGNINWAGLRSKSRILKTYWGLRIMPRYDGIKNKRIDFATELSL